MGWRFCQSMEGWFPNVLNFVMGLARRDIATATAGGQQLVLCPLCPWLPSTFKAAGLLFKALYIYTYICILDIMIPVADYSAWNREWLVFRPEYCRSVWIPTILERFSPSCALFQLQQPLRWVEFLLPIYCKPFFPANLRCNAARKGLTMVPEAGPWDGTIPFCLMLRAQIFFHEEWQRVTTQLLHFLPASHSHLFLSCEGFGGHELAWPTMQGQHAWGTKCFVWARHVWAMKPAYQLISHTISLVTGLVELVACCFQNSLAKTQPCFDHLWSSKMLSTSAVLLAAN